LDSNIYAIGGWLHSSLGPIYDKVEVYNPESDTWYTETQMPVARAVLASIVLGGKIYVYGGARTTHPNIGTSGIYEFVRKPAGLAYAQYARLSRQGRDTVGITTRVENPLAHSLTIVGILTTGSGVLIDSLLLKDDGLHGDSSSADGLWGYLYVPKKDDTIHVTIRTDDLTAGTSRTLLDAAALPFTRGAQIAIDTRTIDLGRISRATSRYDTTFMVCNVGYAADSLMVSIDPVNVTPDTAVSAFPKMLALASGDSQKVTFSILPSLLSTSYYAAQVIVESKFAFGQTSFKKTFQFQVVISSISHIAGVPKVFALQQNYPNPFNPSTTIKFEMPRASHVNLTVFDVLGREVSWLVNERRNAGVHEVKFDGSNLVSGVYFYRLQTGDYLASKKMLILK
jgi:hypothetical protein